MDPPRGNAARGGCAAGGGAGVRSEGGPQDDRLRDGMARGADDAGLRELIRQQHDAPGALHNGAQRHGARARRRDTVTPLT
jgi:hypothetical protein